MSDIVYVDSTSLNGDPSPVRSMLKDIHTGPVDGQKARVVQLVVVSGLYKSLLWQLHVREDYLFFPISVNSCRPEMRMENDSGDALRTHGGI